MREPIISGVNGINEARQANQRLHTSDLVTNGAEILSRPLVCVRHLQQRNSALRDECPQWCVGFPRCLFSVCSHVLQNRINDDHSNIPVLLCDHPQDLQVLRVIEIEACVTFQSNAEQVLRVSASRNEARQYRVARVILSCEDEHFAGTL